MDYNQVTLCEGDSFHISNFLQNHVKVPIEYQLLGWVEGWLDWVSPRQSCRYHLQYARKDGVGGVQLFPFDVQVIPYPSIELEYSTIRLCRGSQIPIPHVQCFSCDNVYWEKLSTGERYSLGENFGVTEGENQKYLLVATNEYCVKMSSKLFEYEVINPDDCRFIIRRIEEEIPLNCWIDIYYKGKYLETLSTNTEESEFHIETIVCDTSMQYYDEIRVELYQSSCNNRFSVSKKIPKNQNVEEKIKQQIKTSYHCQSSTGEGKLCLGSMYSIQDVILRSIHNDDISFSMQDWTDDYNYETFFYPYRYSLPICGNNFKSEKDTFLFSILAKDDLGNDFLFSDSLIVARCHLQEAKMEMICKRDKQQVWVVNSSVDPVIDAELLIDNTLLSVSFVRSKVATDILSQKSVWSIDYDLLTESAIVDFNLNFEGCTSYSNRWQLDLSSCLSSLNKLYYGAYTSPSSILLKQEDCMTFQCSSMEGEEVDTLYVNLSCPNDELFLKFNLSALNNEDSIINLILDKTLDCELIYPFDYQINGDTISWKKSIAKQSTIQVFEIPDDGIISGYLGRVKFVYKISKQPDFLLDSLTICFGDTIDLRDYLSDSNLRWNVETLKFAPESSREFYLYGVTKQGCVVEDSLYVNVLPILWWDKRDTVFCKGKQIESGDILHSNATTIYLNGELFNEGSWIVEHDSLLNFQLISSCDTQTISIQVYAENCDEENQEGFFDINPEITQEEIYLLIGNEEQFILSIYDRGGRLLKQFENKFSGWNGKYKGHLMPTDSYWFELYFPTTNQFKVGYFLWRNH